MEKGGDDICSGPPCHHSLQLAGEAAAAAAAGGPERGGAEAHLDPPAWIDRRRGRCREGWPGPRFPWTAGCRRSVPACSCRGMAADCGCSPRPAISGRRRSL